MPPFSQATYGTYTLLLVDAAGNFKFARPVVPNGAYVTGVGPMRPAAPVVSASNTRVYYLNGPYEIDYLTPDGQSAVEYTLPQDANTRYAFAVSPDDKRLAVAAFTYSAGGTSAAPNFALDLYVQDLQSGANKVDLLKSTTVAEWPVGWHAGNLVVAVGPAGAPSGSVRPNPYYAMEYHVADPSNGNRVAVLGQDYKTAYGNGCNWGPLVAKGTACIEYDAVQAGGPAPTKVTFSTQGWDGTKQVVAAAPVTSNDYRTPVLSPGGDRLAVLDTSPSEHLVFVAADGPHETSVDCQPLGWLDATHLMCHAPNHFGSPYIVLDTESLSQGGIEGEFTVSPDTRFITTVPQQLG